jgi:pimeloyl-ACP methyl ester carboxylesterase
VTNVYVLASRPGPVETAILAELAAGEPGFLVQRRAAHEVAFRYLEGGSGAPLVLLHGRGNAASTWFPLLPELGRRHRVVAVDLPGFGHSSSPPFVWRGRRGQQSFEAGLRFFTDPVETLLLDLNLAGAMIAGHSLGALVAIELALRKRVSPPKLILIGPMGVGPEMSYASRAYFRAGPEDLARRLGSSLFRRIHHPLPAAALGAKLAALSYELSAIRGGRPAPAAAFNALFPSIGRVPNRRDRLGEIEAEVLLLWGERDEVFPSLMAGASAAAFHHAELQVLPLGHSPHLEDPELVLQEMVGYLDR